MGEKKNRPALRQQALYRKYRSKTLDEVFGQEHITKTLANAIELGKISHAYLFTGPKGTGKTSVARILAHRINDLPYQDEQPHLDIIEIDAASNRRIDDIRDLRDKVRIAPVAAKYKVYIIDEVHMLTNESFNALLKTLEEPPEHVVFILATTEVHKLPATIISRAQRHSFRLIPKSKVVKHLAFIAKNEGIAIDGAALELLAEHGGGSFRDSISLLDQLSAHGEVIDSHLIELLLGIAPKDALEHLLQAAEGGDGPIIITTIESLLESGLTASAIANQLLQLLRSRVKAGQVKSRQISLMAELLKVSAAMYPQLKLETILLGVKADSDTAAAVQTSPVTTPVKDISNDTDRPPIKPPQTATPKKPTTPTSAKAPKIKDQPTPTETNITQKWADILEAIKQQHNPLYTVLRLATPEQDEEGLLLIFSFPFHQKKIDEAKHKALIAKVVQEITGLSVAIRAVVDKSRAKPVNNVEMASPAESAHASLIQDVQAIMGGGEIVNV